MRCNKCESQATTRNYPELGSQVAICNDNPLHRQTIDSVLKRSLNEKIENYTDYGEIDYLSNQTPELFKPNTLTFVGASMGVGKTYALFEESKKTRETTIIIAPRVSLAMSLFKAYRNSGSVSCWCSASKQEDRHPGRITHIVTPPMLPTVVNKLHDAPKIAIDEIDFFDNLIRADILSKSSRAIKQILREHSSTGIVALGQTAFTKEMELLADEIGIPLEGIYATKKNPDKHTCNITEIEGDNGKSTAIRKTVEKAAEILSQDKHVYIFADGRRTTHIIKQWVSDITDEPAIVFDRYTRGSEENQELIENQTLDDHKRVFISSNAVDVGISFQDKQGEVIVCSTENLARIGSARSLMQRALRNRVPCPIHIYTYTHNTNPMLPRKYREIEWNKNVYHATEALAERDATLIERHAFVKSLNQLAAIQIEDFLEHHAPIAGIKILDHCPVNGDEEPKDEVSHYGKAYQQECEKEALEAALGTIENKTMWSETRIAKEGSLGRMHPRPYNQLGHEMVNQLACAIGWNGEGCESFNSDSATIGIYNQHHAGYAEYIDDNFFDLLEKIIKEYQKEDHELPNYKAIIQQANGFMRIHTGHSHISGMLVPSAQWDNYNYEANPDLESIHNKDDRLETEVLFQIVKALRDSEVDSIMTEQQAAKLISQALDHDYKGMTLRKHMQKGHLGTQTHQTIMLLNDNDPILNIQFAYDWIAAHYPASLTRHKGKYKLARRPYWNLIKEMTEVLFDTKKSTTWRFSYEDSNDGWFGFDDVHVKDALDQITIEQMRAMIDNNKGQKEIREELGLGTNKCKILYEKITEFRSENKYKEHQYQQEIEKQLPFQDKKQERKARKTLRKKLNIPMRTEQRKWKAIREKHAKTA